LLPGEQGKHSGTGRSFGAAEPATAANVKVRTRVAKNFFMNNLQPRVRVTAIEVS
jgi:hypothetical protein